MWKFFHEVYQTTPFLNSQIHNIGLDYSFGWCQNASETIEHLFHQCTMSRWVWEIVDKWWKIDVA